MRENGYEMDDPDLSSFTLGGEGQGGEGDGQIAGPFGEIDPDDPAFQAAFEACQDVLAGFTSGEGQGGRPLAEMGGRKEDAEPCSM